METQTRPRGVREAEAKRLLWAITDRLEARRVGNGVMAQLSPVAFRETLLILLDEFEQALEARDA